MAYTLAVLLFGLLALTARTMGFKQVGCYVDKSQRILEGQSTSSPNMTIETCVSFCTLQGDYYAGVEYSSQCYCGKNLKEYTKLADSQCSTPCAGDPTQKCGGTWKVMIYTTNDNYLGCYVDKNDRILEGPNTNNDQMTTKYCVNYCQQNHKRFALTEYSSQCFCGNHLKTYEKRPDSECDYKCAGSKGEACGGFWRGSLYTTNTDAP